MPVAAGRHAHGWAGGDGADFGMIEADGDPQQPFQPLLTAAKRGICGANCWRGTRSGEQKTNNCFFAWPLRSEGV